MRKIIDNLIHHSNLVVTKYDVLFKALGGNKQALEEAATVSEPVLFLSWLVSKFNSVIKSYCWVCTVEKASSEDIICVIGEVQIDLSP